MRRDYRSTDIHGVGPRSGRAGEDLLGGVIPISDKIRFFVIKLALDSLIGKVKENTQVFQIPPIPPFVKGGNLMQSLKNLPPFAGGTEGDLVERRACYALWSSLKWSGDKHFISPI